MEYKEFLQINAKIASGIPLTDDEWKALCVHMAETMEAAIVAARPTGAAKKRLNASLARLKGSIK